MFIVGLASKIITASFNSKVHRQGLTGLAVCRFGWCLNHQIWWRFRKSKIVSSKCPRPGSNEPRSFGSGILANVCRISCILSPSDLDSPPSPLHKYSKTRVQEKQHHAKEKTHHAQEKKHRAGKKKHRARKKHHRAGENKHLTQEKNTPYAQENKHPMQRRKNTLCAEEKHRSRTTKHPEEDNKQPALI